MIIKIISGEKASIPGDIIRSCLVLLLSGKESRYMNQIFVSDLGMHGKKAENGFKSISRYANF